MSRRPAPAPRAHTWQFKTRFRRHAFGWRASRLAVQRIREALSEIKAVARRDAMLGAEGAVTFIERLSPALEPIDSSSGALGTAVNRAIETLVPLIAGAPASAGQREGWLERLWAAHAADEIPYIEVLAEYWGELCASQHVASAWADRLLDTTRLALSPDRRVRGHFHGTDACLSALFQAARYEELLQLLQTERFWPYRRWAVRALAAQGQRAEAIRLAEASRGPRTSDGDVDRLCEAILLSSGLVEEAYRRYGLSAHRAGTHLATFRAVAKQYPHQPPAQILADLVERSPGEEGKWFAAAKEAGLYDEALALARRSPDSRPYRARFQAAPAHLRARRRDAGPALAGRGVWLRDHRRRRVGRL